MSSPGPGGGTAGNPVNSPGPGGAPVGSYPGNRRAGFWRSFSFAGQGVWHVVRTQRNMRVHLLAAAGAITAGLVLRISAADWAAVAAAIGLVLTAEILNTVAETIIDLCTDDIHPLAKVAKDAAAGAVLISSLAALGVGIAVFLPRLLRSPG